MTPIILTRTLTIAANQQDQNLQLQFEMPPEIGRLEVSYSFEGLGSGSAVLDLGCLEGTRLRGWTGAARKEFFIATAQATPGYEPGPLHPGKWAVLLGVYRVPPAGMEARVEIRLYPHERQWLRGDLHHHTHHSDGTHSVAEVMQMAEAAGLDFLALTDHNTVTQNRYACESPVLAIPGVEITTPRGHMNILGAKEAVDFRFRSAAEGLRDPLERIHADGGLAMINHPMCDYCPWEYEWDVAFDLVEVWNGLWMARNQRALDWWHDQLVQGRRIPAVGGSDTHTVGLFSVIRTGTPTTYVLAEDRTVPAILAGLNAGRSFISDNPEGPVPWIKVGPAAAGPGESVSPGAQIVHIRLERAEECTLRLIGRDGIVAEREVPEASVEWTIPWEARPGDFLRVEIWSRASGMLRALTNPIYVDLP